VGGQKAGFVPSTDARCTSASSAFTPQEALHGVGASKTLSTSASTRARGRRERKETFAAIRHVRGSTAAEHTCVLPRYRVATRHV